MILVSKIMIDLLEMDDEIIELQKEKKFSYEFVNILEYIKERHDVYIVDLAKVLGTTRPTIYSYFSKKTTDLSDKLKDKIAFVYGVKSFDEVIKNEKRVELAYFYEKPTLEDFVSNDLGLSPDQIDEFQSTFEKIYRIANLDNQYRYVELKKQYDFKLMWKQAIQEQHADELGMKTYRLNSFEAPRLNKFIEDIIEITSPEYIETLLRTIRKKLDTEDLRFINYIDDYDGS